MKRKKQKILAGVGLTLLAGVGALYWFAPGVIDRLRFSGVASECSGVVVIDGDVDGLGGRHCKGALTHERSGNRSMLRFEYARSGRVIVWFGGQMARGYEVRALVRGAGPSGEWSCAHGSFAPRDDREPWRSGELTLLASAPEPPAEHPSTTNGTLTGNAQRVAGAIGGVGDVLAELSGSSCDNEGRCARTYAGTTGVLTVFTTLVDGALDEAFVVHEAEGGALVTIAVAREPSFAKGSLNDLESLELNGLTTIGSCTEKPAMEGASRSLSITF